MIDFFKNLIDINMIWINGLFRFKLTGLNGGGTYSNYELTIGLLFCGCIVVFSTIKLILNILDLRKEDV